LQAAPKRGGKRVGVGGVVGDVGGDGGKINSRCEGRKGKRDKRTEELMD